MNDPTFNGNGRRVAPPASPPTATALDPADLAPMAPTYAYAIMPKHVKAFWSVLGLILVGVGLAALWSWQARESALQTETLVRLHGR